METSAADTGLLPRREPGSFPSPTLVAAWNRLSVELLEGADTGAPPAAAGEEDAAVSDIRCGNDGIRFHRVAPTQFVAQVERIDLDYATRSLWHRCEKAAPAKRFRQRAYLGR